MGVNISTKAKYKKSISRNLRKNMTEAEKRLWSRLRARQFHGLKFRRQHSIGQYIVDFVCLEKSFVVEIDGGQHLENVRDKERDLWLSKEGYRVFRYWNDQVLKETDSVMEDILRKITSPSPSPSPQGRGDMSSSRS